MALCLSEAESRAVLPRADVIGAMEAALSSCSCGGAVQPVRAVAEMSEDAFIGRAAIWQP